MCEDSIQRGDKRRLHVPLNDHDDDNEEDNDNDDTDDDKPVQWLGNVQLCMYEVVISVTYLCIVHPWSLEMPFTALVVIFSNDDDDDDDDDYKEWKC